MCSTVLLVLAGGRVVAQTAPGDPTIDSLTPGPDSLTVSWSAPMDDGGSAITAYDLRYIETSAADKTDDANWTVIEDVWTTGPDALTYVLSGLRDQTGYDVQLRAENADGGVGDWPGSSTAATTTDHGATTSSATTVSLGTSIPGRILTTGDEDYFELVLASDTEVWIHTTGDLDTAGAVLNSSATLTASNGDARLPPNPTNFSIREELAAGTWYISVGGEDGEHSGLYTLHVRAVTSPGSTSATATAFTPGSVLPGSLSPGGVNYFKIEFASAADLWVLAIGETDTTGELLNSSLSVVARNDDSELRGNRSSFSLRAQVAAGQTYYIKVQGADADEEGAYLLYAGAVTDPGDTPATAASLRMELPAPGRMDAADDADYFSLTLDSATYLRLEAQPLGATLRLTPTLFDDEDTELDLYYINEGDWSQITRMGLSFWALDRLPAGTYTIRITPAEAGTGPYLLHASVDADALAYEETCQSFGNSQSDPLYGCQWHLNNTNQYGSGPGFDINVEEAWAITKGEGINVLVVDNGLDYLHSDLRGYEYESADPNDDSMGHEDLTGRGVRHRGADHGTPAAGIIVSRDNDIGGRGVAPRATVYGLNFFDSGSRLRVLTANALYAAGYKSDVTAVSSNSWRFPSQNGVRKPAADWDAAVEEAVSSGYGGKGVFFVFIAGNGAPFDDANTDPTLNHYGITTVCAVNYNDVRAGYSVLGANLWVCGPSGGASSDLPYIPTTNVGNVYSDDFGGTSAAAPVVAGVAALVRAANTDLTWRDVKLILAASARKNDSSNGGWLDGALEYGSDSDHYSFNHEYGFGVVDAGAAVNLALGWDPLPPFREISAGADVELALPDLESGGTPQAVSSSVTLAPYVGFVEHMVVEVELSYRRCRDLKIELVSPSGTASTLLPSIDEPVDCRGENSTVCLGSARHLGEDSAGQWTLRIADEHTDNLATFHSWKLTAYGHGYTPGAPGIASASPGPGAGITVAWSAPAAGDTGESAITGYDVRHIRSDATDKTTDNWTVLEGVWSSGDLKYGVTGLEADTGYDIQVRAVNDGGAGLWSEIVAATTPAAPGAPSRPTVAARDGALAVSWAAPADDGGSPIESYDVRRIESDALDKTDTNWSEEAGVWTSGSGGDLRYVVSPLANGRQYDVQIRAVNAVGAGPWSGTATGTPMILNHDPSFPAAETGNRSVEENTPAGRNIGAVVQATDVENDTLTYTLSGVDAAAFEMVGSTGQVRTRDALNHEDRDRYVFTVSVSDGTDTNGEPDPTIDDSITVTVTVTDVNEAPGITDGVTSTGYEENQTRAVDTYIAEDPDEGDMISWELRGADNNLFTITSNIDGEGVLAFDSPPDFEAARSPIYRVTVVARDNEGGEDTRPVVITVDNVNEPPVVTGPDLVPYRENSTANVGSYTAIDPDGDTVLWSVLGDDADRFEIERAGNHGVLTFRLAPDFESPQDRDGDNAYEVTVRASDNELVGGLPVTVNVTNEEEAGSLALSSMEPRIGIDFIATLEDPDVVQTATWAWQSSAPNLSSGWTLIAGATGNTYRPAGADRDRYLRVTVEYADALGSGKLLERTSSFPTQPECTTNTAPTFQGPVPDLALAENAGGPAAVDIGAPVVATDAEFDPLTYSLAVGGFSTDPPFTIHETTAQVRLAAGATLDYESLDAYSVAVTARDSCNAVGTATFEITVTDVNEAPTAVDDTASTVEDKSTSIDVLDNDRDPENDDLTITSVSRPRNGGTATVETDETITYAPRGNYHGQDRFSYTIADEHGETDTATVIVTITADNDAPVFPEGQVRRTVSEAAQRGAEVGAPVIAHDQDGDALVYSLSPSTGAFAIEQDSGQITVRDPAQLAPGNYTVTITADDTNSDADGNRGVDTIDITITVTERAVAPTIIGGGGFGGFGGGGPSGPTPSEVDFEWNVERDIEALAEGNGSPSGVWSGGETLWILDNPDGAGDAVYVYDRETGERLEEREFELDGKNGAPRGVWSDRETLWVSDSGQERLFAYDLESGERLEDRDIELTRRNRDARGIWSDGATIWVLNRNPSLFVYDLETGALLGEYELAEANSSPHGMWSDEVTVWVSNHDPKRLYAYRLPVPPDEPPEEPPALERVADEDFEELGRVGNNSPRGIWSDGAVMYVADENDDRVYSYNMPDAIDARLASLELSGVDFGEFSPAQREYEGVPGEGVTVTTVVAEAAQDTAAVGTEPSDADEEAEGHQVALAGVDEIAVTVTSADGSRERVYRVRLAEAGEAGPPASCLRGAVSAGFSLVVSEGGSVDDLVSCAERRHVTALYALHEGDYEPYILGAPDFVNARFRALFPEGVPALTPLTVNSDGPATPAPPAPEVTEPFATCVLGAIADGFSLVVYEGGSVHDLVACAEGLGVTAVYVLAEGEWVSYILGAPEFVNTRFRALFADGVPVATPLVVRGEGP